MLFAIIEGEGLFGNCVKNVFCNQLVGKEEDEVGAGGGDTGLLVIKLGAMFELKVDGPDPGVKLETCRMASFSWLGVED